MSGSTGDAPIEFELGSLEFRDLLADGFPNPLQAAIMPVIALVGDEAHVRGTAFSIGGHLALTATHVVDRTDQLDEVALLHIAPGPSEGQVHSTLLPVEEVTAHPDQTDVAVLSLERNPTNGEPLNLQPFRLGAAPPQIGERCVVIGYGAKARMHSRAQVLELRPVLNVSEGTVVDQYPTGAALCRFPCFQIDGRTDHQMSGGPILTDDGSGMLLVRGIASTGMDVVDGETPLSFGSMTFPALALDPVVDTGTGPARTFIHTLAQGGCPPVPDLDLVDFDSSDPQRPSIGLRRDSRP